MAFSGPSMFSTCSNHYNWLPQKVTFSGPHMCSLNLNPACTKIRMHPAQPGFARPGWVHNNERDVDTDIDGAVQCSAVQCSAL